MLIVACGRARALQTLVTLRPRHALCASPSALKDIRPGLLPKRLDKRTHSADRVPSARRYVRIVECGPSTYISSHLTSSLSTSLTTMAVARSSNKRIRLPHEAGRHGTTRSVTRVVQCTAPNGATIVYCSYDLFPMLNTRMQSSATGSRILAVNVLPLFGAIAQAAPA